MRINTSYCSNCFELPPRAAPNRQPLLRIDGDLLRTANHFRIESFASNCNCCSELGPLQRIDTRCSESNRLRWLATAAPNRNQFCSESNPHWRFAMHSSEWSPDLMLRIKPIVAPHCLWSYIYCEDWPRVPKLQEVFFEGKATVPSEQ